MGANLAVAHVPGTGGMPVRWNGMTWVRHNSQLPSGEGVYARTGGVESYYYDGKRWHRSAARLCTPKAVS